MAALLSSSGPALARPTPERQRAHDLAVEGHEALERRDFAKAADRYTRAEALVHAPTLLLGLAQAHVGLGRLVEARASYRRILAEGVAASAPAPWVEALKTARVELAALEPRVPRVTIRVEGADAAVVDLDGARLAAADVGRAVAVDPGRHEVRVSVRGHQVEVRAFVAREGASSSVSIVLDGTRPAPTPTPAPKAPAAAASESSPFPWTPLGIGAVVIGGSGIAAGAITGGLAWGDHATLASECQGGACPKGRAGTLDRFHALATASTVAFVVGAIGLAGGASLLLLAPDAGPEKAAAVRPFLGVGSAGARGVF